MKKLLLLRYFSLFVGLVLIAGVTRAQLSVRGMVLDSLNKEPLAFGTISLKNSSTGQPVKSGLTGKDGSFELKAVPHQSLQLVLTFTGYQNKVIDLNGKSGAIELGHIRLLPVSGKLKEVTVTAARPLLKREVDRLSYDVQADPDNKTFNTLDMLRKVPLLSVDGYEKIRLKGSASFKILVNGKESPMTAHNPEEALRSMPAISVERIEVITTPPAKYDGEGLAGIINIITKRNTDEGYNVNSNVRYNSIFGPVANTSLTVKQGKFGVTGFVSYSYRAKLTNPLGSVRETYLPVRSTLTQEGEEISGQGRHVENIVKLSYDIDTLNLLTASYVNYFEKNINQLDQLSAERDAGGLLTQQYKFFEDGYSRNNNTSAELNFQHGFKRSKQQLITFAYKFDHSDYAENRQVQFSDQVNYGGPDYRQPSRTGTQEHTAQLDYAQPLQQIILESGVKAIFRDNQSDYAYNELNSTAYVPVPAFGNQFTYQQKVYSAYTSGQLTTASYVAKAGLRLEQTRVAANFASSAQSISKVYSSLLPSFSVQRNFKNWNLTLGAANRLMRPNIWDLNPFVDRSNPKFLTTGNPELHPIIMHVFELNYTNLKQHNITAGLSYQVTNNNIENVRTILPDTVTFRQPKNLGKLRYLTLNAGINMNLSKQWQLNTNGQVNYVTIKGKDNGILMQNRGFQGNLSLDSSYQFNAGWRVSTNVSYNTGYVEFQGNSNYYFYSSFRLSKEMPGKKLLFTLTANNPYSSRVTLHGTGFSPEFYRNEYYTDYYRTIAVSINYKFGHLSSDIKKSQHTIRNDDLRGGGKG
jgi:hypothetical protein